MSFTQKHPSALSEVAKLFFKLGCIGFGGPAVHIAMMEKEALLNPLIPRLRKSPVMSAFLNTVNVASIALIVVVCIEMGRTSINDWKTICIAILGFATILRYPKLNTAFIVLGGALAGYLLSFI